MPNEMIPHFLWFSLASTAIPETLIPGSHRYSRNTVCLIPEQLRGIAVGSGNKRFGNTGNKRFGNKLEYGQDQMNQRLCCLRFEHITITKMLIPE